MPVPIAIALITIMLITILIGICVIINEIRKWIREKWQARSISVAWISNEEPGYLDYEADLERANGKFIKEMEKLTRDTNKFSTKLPKHQKRIERAVKAGNPRMKQKRADKSAKEFGRNALFIGERQKLFKKLINEVHRCSRGIISTLNLNQEEISEDVRIYHEALNQNLATINSTIQSLVAYRDATQQIVDMNISRTIRIESTRLVEALNILIKLIQQHNQNNQKLKKEIDKKVTISQ